MAYGTDVNLCFFWKELMPFKSNFTFADGIIDTCMVSIFQFFSRFLLFSRMGGLVQKGSEEFLILEDSFLNFEMFSRYSLVFSWEV